MIILTSHKTIQDLTAEDIPRNLADKFEKDVFTKSTLDDMIEENLLDFNPDEWFWPEDD